MKIAHPFVRELERAGASQVGGLDEEEARSLLDDAEKAVRDLADEIRDADTELRLRRIADLLACIREGLGYPAYICDECEERFEQGES